MLGTWMSELGGFDDPGLPLGRLQWRVRPAQQRLTKIEHGIQIAALGGLPPQAVRFLDVALYALSFQMQDRKIVETPRVAGHRGTTEPMHGLANIRLDTAAEAILVSDGIHTLGVALPRRQEIEAQGLFLILRDAVTPRVHIAKIDLGIGIAPIRGRFQEPEGGGDVTPLSGA
jgi:hypothetical protein